MFYKNENNNSNTDVQIHSPNHHTFHSEKRLLNLYSSKKKKRALCWFIFLLVYLVPRRYFLLLSLVDFLQVLQYSICCDSIGGLKKIDEQRDPCIESGLYNRLEGKKFADMTKVDEP